MTPILNSKLKKYSAFQLSRNIETSIGYYTNVGAGLNLRLGLISDKYYEAQNVGSGFNAQAAGEEAEKNSFQCYLFANPKLRLIGYNTLLQGRIINDGSIYTLKFNEMSKVLFEFDCGLMVNYYGLRFALIPFSLRTSELRTNYKRTHYYGTAYLSLSF